jgi:hypothetical protein
MTFEVFMVVNILIVVLWVVTPYKIGVFKTGWKYFLVHSMTDIFHCCSLLKGTSKVYWRREGDKCTKWIEKGKKHGRG